MTRVDFSKSLVLLATIALALLNWAAVRGGHRPTASDHRVG
jgi:hypothetical protein